MTPTTDYLLDTNMLGYLAEAKSGVTERQVKNVQDRIEAICAQAERKLFIAAITVGEAEYGLRVAPSANMAQQTIARKVLNSFPVVLPIDKSVAHHHYAAIRAELFSRFAPKTVRGTARKNCVEQWIDPTTGSALGIDENDLWIVATAAVHNLTLVTNDKLRRIIEAVSPPIRIENWTEPLAP